MNERSEEQKMLPGTEANAMSGIIRTYMNFHLILSRLLLRMLMWNCQSGLQYQRWCNVWIHMKIKCEAARNEHSQGDTPKGRASLPSPSTPHKWFSRICKLFSSYKETSIHSCMRTFSHLLWCNNESFAHWPTYFRDIWTHTNTPK